MKPTHRVPQLALALVLASGCYVVIGCGHDSQPAPSAPSPQAATESVDIGDAVKQALEASKNGGSTVIVQEPGKARTIVTAPVTVRAIDTTNSKVKVQTESNASLVDGNPSTTEKATIILPQDDPTHLSRSLYDKLQPGMTHPEISALVGGDEALNCRVDSAFRGDLVIQQGAATITLHYQGTGPRLVSKSQQGLE
ncbi:MAG TPA: hypothetical protein VGZ22_25240 [Isosphaeraceae bacterium]|jgi:hypothetical protein|nr:hypothetical protein [Isosphaeraceae bacterium]